MTQPGRNSSEGSPSGGGASHTQSVLVVDDDCLVADSLAMILERFGYQARPVYSGEEAIQAAATLRPDYFVSDIFMDELNGIDAARLISDRLPDCKVILFSGNVDAEDLIEGARLSGPAFKFLRKPFHPEVLLQCLRATIVDRTGFPADPPKATSMLR